MPGRYRQREDDFILNQRQHIELAIAVNLDRVNLVVLQLIIRQILPDTNRQQGRPDRQIPIQPTEATLATQHQPPVRDEIKPGLALGIEAARKLPAHHAFIISKPIGKPRKARHRHFAFQRAATGGKPENVNDARCAGSGAVLLEHKQIIVLFFPLPVKTTTNFALGMNVRPSLPCLVLASTSIYRRQLLERFGLPFEASSPQVDETRLPGEAPERLAQRLALAKARDVSRKHSGALIIGSDQVAALGAEIFGKPGSIENAASQLQHMSGQEVLFHTAVALIDGRSGREQHETVLTRVRFRPLSEPEIRRYLEREPALDCAGSAKCEGLGITLLDALSGDDPTALIGLPLIALARMLRAAGVELP
jgi:septum formation protein